MARVILAVLLVVAVFGAATASASANRASQKAMRPAGTQKVSLVETAAKVGMSDYIKQVQASSFGAAVLLNTEQQLQLGVTPADVIASLDEIKYDIKHEQNEANEAFIKAKSNVTTEQITSDIDQKSIVDENIQEAQAAIEEAKAKNLVDALIIDEQTQICNNLADSIAHKNSLIQDLQNKLTKQQTTVNQKLQETSEATKIVNFITQTISSGTVILPGPDKDARDHVPCSLSGQNGGVQQFSRLPACQSLMQVANTVKLHQFTHPDLRAAVQTAITIAKTAHMKAKLNSHLQPPLVSNPDGGSPPQIAQQDTQALLTLLSELSDDIASFNSSLSGEDTELSTLITNLQNDVNALTQKQNKCNQLINDATQDKTANDQTITDQTDILTSNQTLSKQLEEEIDDYLIDVAEITQDYNTEFEHREEELRLIACIRRIICEYYLDDCYENYNYHYDYNSYVGSESSNDQGGEWVWVPFHSKGRH